MPVQSSIQLGGLQTPEVPGPKGLPIIGNLPVFFQDELHLALMDLHQEYGDIFRLKLVNGHETYVIRHPEMMQHVLQLNNRNYVKGERIKVVEPLIGNGLFMSEGDYWRRQRRMMQPSFHRRQISVLAEEMIATIDEMLRRWARPAAEGKRIEVQHEMMSLTMEIVTRTLFTNSLTPAEVSQVGETIGDLLETIAGRSREIFSIQSKLPTPRNRRFKRGIQKIDALVFRLIEDRRAAGDPGDDLLGMLLTVRDKTTGQVMNDRQLRDELVTMFLAGHETTALALSWSLGLLGQHPAVLRKLQHEVDTVLGARKPTAADFMDLTYTQAVLQEAMRLYPPLVVTARQALADDHLAGNPLPAGAQLMIHFYGLHHHPDFWEKPDRFDPERFMPENSQVQHRFAYLPFSGGPRQCIGNHFALMEGTLALAMITQQFELSLPEGSQLIPTMIGTLRPKGGIHMNLRRRVPH